RPAARITQQHGGTPSATGRWRVVAIARGLVLLHGALIGSPSRITSRRFDLFRALAPTQYVRPAGADAVHRRSGFKATRGRARLPQEQGGGADGGQRALPALRWVRSDGNPQRAWRPSAAPSFLSLRATRRGRTPEMAASSS